MINRIANNYFSNFNHYTYEDFYFKYSIYNLHCKRPEFHHQIQHDIGFVFPYWRHLLSKLSKRRSTEMGYDHK